jgi:hypothetical protein
VRATVEKVSIGTALTILDARQQQEYESAEKLQLTGMRSRSRG